MKKFLTLTALSTILMATQTQAAGFHLREQSAAAQGNSYAGATAGAENLSYAYYNVAGLTRHKGFQMNLGATSIAPKVTSKNVRYADGRTDRGEENVVHSAVSPNGNFSYQLSDKAFIGLGLNSAFGLITKYAPDWAGADHGMTSDLKSALITPMGAYKVTDKLSVGAGLQIQYVWAHLTSSNSATHTNVVTTDGDALDFGYQLGALYEFTDSTRIGIGYRSEIKHKLKGDMKTSEPIPHPLYNALMNQDISVRLNTPAVLSFGAYHDITSRWAVMAEYQRVFWGSFRKLDFVSRSGNNRSGASYISSVKENWRNTNFYSIGTSYWLDEQWKLRLGFAYDQSAVRFEHRTPRIPDSDRIWYSVGLGYKYSEKLSFDAGFTYISGHKAHMDTSVTNNGGAHATAEFSSSVKALAFSVNYAF